MFCSYIVALRFNWETCKESSLFFSVVLFHKGTFQISEKWFVISASNEQRLTIYVVYYRNVFKIVLIVLHIMLE